MRIGNLVGVAAAGITALAVPARNEIKAIAAIVTYSAAAAEAMNAVDRAERNRD